MQQPARNLYLLELMYLLLSLGFEGKFGVRERGPIALEALRDKIYKQVRLLRGEPPQDLSKKVTPGQRAQPPVCLYSGMACGRCLHFRHRRDLYGLFQHS